MKNARLEKELTLETPDKVGVAGQLTTLFKAANLNIKSLLAKGENGKGHFVIIPENNDKAKQILQGSPFSNYQENEVIVVNAEDKAGSCADVANALSNAGVNIKFLYTTIFDNQAAIVLSTDDNKKALSALHS